jgi:hypothetical protein
MATVVVVSNFPVALAAVENAVKVPSCGLLLPDL